MILLLFLSLLACASFPLAPIEAGSIPLFPVDVGPHDSAPTEWWHLHADLEDLDSGEPIHVFAGFMLERTDGDRVLGFPAALAVNPLHVGYVRLQQGEQSWTADRYNMPDLWSARFVGRDRGDGALDLRHGDWRLAWEHGAWFLEISAGPHRLKLRFTPGSAAVLPGDAGLVELRPGSPHHWVQLESLRVDGQWRHHGQTRWVEGSGFYKHQWGELYDEDFEGFEWLSLDLPGETVAPAIASNGGTPLTLPSAGGRSLSIAWLQQEGMRGLPGSLAWISDREGRVVPIPVSTLRVTPIAWWHSPRSRSDWPVAWHLEAPGIDLEVRCEQEDHELWVFPLPIHAGPARATGHFMGQEVDVPAFAEQTGARIPWLYRLVRPLVTSNIPEEDR